MVARKILLYKSHRVHQKFVVQALVQYETHHEYLLVEALLREVLVPEALEREQNRHLSFLYHLKKVAPFEEALLL
jgi:hypothetical protein